MNRKQYFLSPIRITLLSGLGLLQFMFVMFGCVWAADNLVETYPIMKHLRGAAPGVGILSLLYPVYVLAAMELPKRRQLKPAEDEASSNQPSHHAA